MIIRGINLVSILCSWQRAPKTLIISCVMRVRGESFVTHNHPLSIIPDFILMRWLLEAGSWFPEEPTLWLEPWNFLSYPQTFEKGRLIYSAMVNDWINHTYVMELYRNPEEWGLESIWVSEHIKVLEKWHIERVHGNSCSFPHTLLYASHLAVPEL